MVKVGKKQQCRFTVCYDEEFIPDLDLFVSNIHTDKRMIKRAKKNKNQLMSASIRTLILIYNNQRKQIKEKQDEEQSTN